MLAEPKLIWPPFSAGAGNVFIMDIPEPLAGSSLASPPVTFPSFETLAHLPTVCDARLKADAPIEAIIPLGPARVASGARRDAALPIEEDARRAKVENSPAPEVAALVAPEVRASAPPLPATPAMAAAVEAACRSWAVAKHAPFVIVAVSASGAPMAEAMIRREVKVITRITTCKSPQGIAAAAPDKNPAAVGSKTGELPTLWIAFNVLWQTLTTQAITLMRIEQASAFPNAQATGQKATETYLITKFEAAPRIGSNDNIAIIIGRKTSML